MSTSTTSATLPLVSPEVAARDAAVARARLANARQPLATAPQTPLASAPSVAVGAAATGAAGVQVEAFNAPRLELPDDPTTADVLTGLKGAMTDPTTNESSAKRLYDFHQGLLEMHKSMIQAIVDGVAR